MPANRGAYRLARISTTTGFRDSGKLTYRRNPGRPIAIGSHRLIVATKRSDSARTATPTDISRAIGAIAAADAKPVPIPMHRRPGNTGATRSRNRRDRPSMPELRRPVGRRNPDPHAHASIRARDPALSNPSTVSLLRSMPVWPLAGDPGRADPGDDGAVFAAHAGAGGRQGPARQRHPGRQLRRHRVWRGNPVGPAVTRRWSANTAA